MNLKSQLRAKYKKWMNENVKNEFSLLAGEAVLNKINEKLQGIPQPKVSIFISKLPEISTIPLINHLYEIGAQVFIPAWHSEEMWMCLVENKREFDEILRSAPSNKIPMPSTNRIAIEVKKKKIIYIYLGIVGCFV